MELSDYRMQIDAIDRELVRLFVQRMEVAAAIGSYKKEHDLPILVPAREQEKLQEVSALAGPEMAPYTRELYTTLFALSRSYQSRKTSPLKCGLLGRKLGHSYSPRIHSQLGSYDYQLYEVEPDALARFLHSSDLSGFNVTMPYKKDVIPYLDRLTDVAKRLGAVNTVVRQPDGTLLGHNTDFYGFQSLVHRSGFAVSGKKALVLGSGGASNTVTAVLRDMGAEVIVVSRSGADNYESLHRHMDAAFIVNTTPVGMYPNTGTAPVDLRCFQHLEGVLDVVYNPARTRLLQDAASLGIPWANGLWMLVAQAKESAEYFTGAPIDDAVMETVYRTLSRQTQNIILIGMPGCGKSTVAQALAQITGRVVLDSDRKVEEIAGKTIPEIFAQDGEEAFRQLETQVLREAGKESGLIIATGGGCVTVAENEALLTQNGKIFWLQRSLDKLPTQGRPLSQSSALTELYARREGLYRTFCHCIVDNNAALSQTVAHILKRWEAMV